MDSFFAIIILEVCMRVSSRCVLIENDKVLLIYREKNGKVYYVFPGGGVEIGETNEECLIRECREELGIEINIIKQLYEVKGKDFLQHFFLIEKVSGEIGTGDVHEYDINRVGGLQRPMFININELEELNVVSRPIVKQLLSDYKKYGSSLGEKIITIDEDK